MSEKVSTTSESNHLSYRTSWEPPRAPSMIMVWGLILFVVATIPAIFILEPIDFSPGALAYFIFGTLIFIEIFLIALLVTGIRYWHYKISFTVDKKGLAVHEVHTGNKKGVIHWYGKSDIIRIYSNVISHFPYFFIIYNENGKKKCKEWDKSELRDYDELLIYLGKIAQVVEEGEWTYRDLKKKESL